VNSFSKSGYGFTTNNSLDGTARHESYHAFYCWTVRISPARVVDNDQPIRDRLPGEQGPDMQLGDPVTGSIIARLKAFEYTFDSGVDPILEPNNPYRQKYFPYGSQEIYQTGKNSYTKALQYQGDQITDSFAGKQKVRLKKVSPFDLNNIPPEITLDLPENLPIEEVKVIGVYVGLTKGIDPNVTGTKQVPLLPRDPRDLVPAATLEPIDYGDPKKPTVKLQLHLSQREIDSIKKLKDKGYTIDGLYIYYIIQCPYGMDEYDASRMQPGEYEGWQPPRR
jgi:hypothetical protein